MKSKPEENHEKLTAATTLGRQGFFAVPCKPIGSQGFRVRIKVIDVRQAFGRTDLGICPVDGAGDGTAWVDSKSVTLDPKVVVINDGQSQFAVTEADFNAWSGRHGPLTKHNYNQFCEEVLAIDEDLVGTQDMIDLCRDYIQGGAKVVNV